MKQTSHLKAGFIVGLVALALTACSSQSSKPATSSATGTSTGVSSGNVATGSVGGSGVAGSGVDTFGGADRVFYFDFDQAILKPESLAALRIHAQRLLSSPVNVRLEGHADERGSREYNMALGERRATAVKEFLVLQGVDPSLMEVISYGEERPAAIGSTEADWALNRRVELK